MLQRSSQHLVQYAMRSLAEHPATTLNIAAQPTGCGALQLCLRWSATDSSASGSSHTSSGSAGPEGAPIAAGTVQESYPAYDVSYKGSFCTPHRWLKQASLLNTFTSLAASPLVIMYAEMGLVGRVGLAITLSGFGLVTTGALHWFTKPYVHELNYTGSTGEIEVKTIDLLSRLRPTKFHISEVTFAQALHPAVTFAAKGRPYFIEKNIFPDANLLDYLTPEDPALANAPRIKDDDDD